MLHNSRSASVRRLSLWRHSKTSDVILCESRDTSKAVRKHYPSPRFTRISNFHPSCLQDLDTMTFDVTLYFSECKIVFKLRHLGLISDATRRGRDFSLYWVRVFVRDGFSNSSNRQTPRTQRKPNGSEFEKKPSSKSNGTNSSSSIMFEYSNGIG